MRLRLFHHVAVMEPDTPSGRMFRHISQAILSNSSGYSLLLKKRISFPETSMRDVLVLESRDELPWGS